MTVSELVKVLAESGTGKKKLELLKGLGPDEPAENAIALLEQHNTAVLMALGEKLFGPWHGRLDGTIAKARQIVAGEHENAWEEYKWAPPESTAGWRNRVTGVFKEGRKNPAEEGKKQPVAAK